jgi:hypothetical protein
MLNDAGEMTMARTAATGAHTAEQLLSVLVIIKADVAEEFVFVVVHYFDVLNIGFVVMKQQFEQL